MSFYQPDARAYLQYYAGQSGAGSIPKFHGGQYGYGLGGLLRSLIRKIIPIGRSVARFVSPVARKAYKIAKPHLKTAAKELVDEGIRTVTRKIAQKMGDSNGQSGGRRRRKRKAGAIRRRRKTVKRIGTKRLRKPAKKRRGGIKRRRRRAAATSVLNAMPNIF